MTINEIFLNKEISIQAYHTCVDNNINTLLELVAYCHKVFQLVAACVRNGLSKIARKG